MEQNKFYEEQKQNPEIDDENEIVTIDYFDYINKKWIKIDVAKWGAPQT